MKIALFGGSFNPIHLAHLEIARYVSDNFNIDEFIFMPAFLNPFKVDDNVDFLSANERLDIIKKVIELENIHFKYKFKVSDYEINQKKVSYTYKTIDYLKKTYVHYQPLDIFLIIGTDNFKNIEKWKNFEYLCNQVSFIVFLRNEDDFKDILKYSNLLKEKYNLNSFVMNNKKMNISSSEIREKFKNKKDFSKIVDKYINDMYK